MEVIYKGYIIKPAPKSPALLTVATEGKGGKIPKVLEGMFTSHGTVKHTIDTYLESKEAQVKEA